VVGAHALRERHVARAQAARMRATQTIAASRQSWTRHSHRTAGRPARSDREPRRRPRKQGTPPIQECAATRRPLPRRLIHQWRHGCDRATMPFHPTRRHETRQQAASAMPSRSRECIEILLARSLVQGRLIFFLHGIKATSVPKEPRNNRHRAAHAGPVRNSALVIIAARAPFTLNAAHGVGRRSGRRILACASSETAARWPPNTAKSSAEDWSFIGMSIGTPRASRYL
jgi:hypothetical protein